MNDATLDASLDTEEPDICATPATEKRPAATPPARSRSSAPLLLAALILTVVGLGCGQFTVATTVEREESGVHNGTWEIAFEVDQAVFDELQKLSPEPIDLDYRASLFREEGWDAVPGTTGLSAHRSFVVPDELNKADNPLVMLFSGTGEETHEENIVRYTELEIDDSDPDRIHYTFTAEIYVPQPEPDQIIDQVELSLGGADAVASTGTAALKDALIAAGPFVVQMDLNLPGEVDEASISPGGRLEGNTVRWVLDQNMTYGLKAESTLELGEQQQPSEGSDSTLGEEPAEEPVDGETGDDTTPGALAKEDSEAGESGALPPHKAAAVLLAVLGGVVAVGGAKSLLAAGLTAPGPWTVVIIGGGSVALAWYVWNHGPPPPPPNPVGVFIEAAKTNVESLERASLGGFTAAEARELGVELEKLSPQEKQAVAKQLGVEYQTLAQALQDGSYKEILKPPTPDD